MNAHTPSSTRTSADVVTRIVTAGLDRASCALGQVTMARGLDPHDHAARATRLHVLHTRRARWWSVLQRSAIADQTVPTVYLRAIVAARRDAEECARFWRDTAADWTARAEQRPTSDVAGAMSNWDELGITELGRTHPAETIGAQR